MIRKGDVVYLTQMDDPQRKRPFVVVSNDTGNKYSEFVIVVPMTMKHRRLDMATHYITEFNDSMVLAEQIYTVNQDEIDRVVSRLGVEDMKNVDKCLKVSLGIAGE